MAAPNPIEVQRLASIGTALEGTINITQEDIDEVPSKDETPTAVTTTLPAGHAEMLAILMKKESNCAEFVWAEFSTIS